MAESAPVEKRGPGRPPKATPAPKRQKVSHATPKESTPTTTTARESPSTQPNVPPGLPSKISTTAPLPALLQPQSPAVPDSEYQSLASSAVLAASLERSQQAWTRDGIFERFWRKPEGRTKGSDPVLKSMKDKGRCRLRIEPHIFEVNLWVVSKPRPPAPPKPQPQYRPPQQNQFYQNRPLPPNGQPQPLAPLQSRPPPTPQPPAQPAQPATPAADKKPSPDPVISMLATRASSDPELKALMKEVATGKATQEQLKVFQKHIDELSAAIQSQKAKEAAEEEKLAKQKQTPQTPNIAPQPMQPYVAPQQQTPTWQPPPPPQQQYVPPPPPPPSEVVFAFTLAGATEDRFLFPQYSILEPLSAQHVLASFIVTRKCSEAADPIGLKLDPDTEYWQPVTMMVEVAYGREPLLKDVSKWVKPAEEVREEMKKIMQRCTRAPETFLPLRLPIKGTASVLESETASKTGTPAPDERKGSKAKLAAAGKRSSLAKEASANDKEKKVDGKQARAGAAAGAAKPDGANETPVQPDAAEKPAADAATEGAKDENADAARPRRTTRKSVRISEV
ncbi:hypothetical protein WHR41_03842 [Cladosporium halotolerans]|uniref:SWR1-complex protein 3 domain-containing protein n=1 Tax=Cladosporium halotolerans TaxID=1052096 RepID=A0AB34KQY5_9PEZI